MIFHCSKWLIRWRGGGGTSIGDGIAMGQQLIALINVQNAEFFSSHVIEHETDFQASIGIDVEGLAPNSNCTNVIEGPTIMGNASICRIVDQLNSNSTPTHMAKELHSLSKAPSSTHSAHPTAHSMPRQPTNNSMKISANFEPPFSGIIQNRSCSIQSG